MAVKINKIVNTKKTKWFWAYIAIGAIVTVLSIMLMPFWKDGDINVFFKEWGYKTVKIIVAVSLALYCLCFVLKKILTKSNGVVKVLTIIEFVLLMLVAIGSVLSQFNVIKVSGVGQILGLALWLRGVVEIFRAYYYQRSHGETKYPVWQLAIAIALVTLGVYFAVSNVLSDKLVLWIITVTLCLGGIFAIILGCFKKPEPAKKAKA